MYSLKKLGQWFMYDWTGIVSTRRAILNFLKKEKIDTTIVENFTEKDWDSIKI